VGTVEAPKFLDTSSSPSIFLGVVGRSLRWSAASGVEIANVVVERMREIGIKMALGARRGYILRQFLFETSPHRDRRRARLRDAWDLRGVPVLPGRERRARRSSRTDRGGSRPGPGHHRPSPVSSRRAAASLKPVEAMRM
jgi:hypothetical protein